MAQEQAKDLQKKISSLLRHIDSLYARFFDPEDSPDVENMIRAQENLLDSYRMTLDRLN